MVQPVIDDRAEEISAGNAGRQSQSERKVLAEPGEITIRSQLGSFLRFGLKAGPATQAGHVEAELIEHAADDMVDEVVESLGPVVKSRGGRENDGADAGKREHILQMNLAERAFARQKDELAALLQCHVRGPADERIAEACPDASERLHTARRDKHAIGFERAARNAGGLILVLVNNGSKLFDFIYAGIGFVLKSRASPTAED